MPTGSVKGLGVYSGHMDPLTEKTQNTGFNRSDYLLAALGYVWFICVLIWLWKKDDAFISQHAKNGTALFVLSILWFIPGVGFIVLLFELYGFFMAFVGKPWKMPLIGDWLEKFRL